MGNQFLLIILTFFMILKFHQHDFDFGVCFMRNVSIAFAKFGGTHFGKQSYQVGRQLFGLVLDNMNNSACHKKLDKTSALL